MSHNWSKTHITNGIAVLRSQHINQGTTFSDDVRSYLNLHALVPAAHETLDQQVKRAMSFLRSLESPLERYLYLSRIKTEDVTLFYKLCVSHLEEVCPIIYTPTIGEVCQKFSWCYTPGFAEGLFISLKHKGQVANVLRNWTYPNPEICVITDGSRILGLGDLGINGAGIPIGKLSLYVAAAGFSPHRTLPITLDLGTDNEAFLKDEFYLGLRQKRPSDREFFEFMDEVMDGLKTVFPNMLVQFEDFSSEHAFACLDRYRTKYMCFNDDIEGTGAVIMSGFINAIVQSGTPISEQRVLFYGAGSAAVGVARQIMAYFVQQGGITREAARNAFYLVDRSGLVTADRADAKSGKIQNHKLGFMRSDVTQDDVKGTSLSAVCKFVQPTALVGLSSVGGAFTPDIIGMMDRFNPATLGKRPIIFPLSNPATAAECSYVNAMRYTNGRVIFASGTAFDAIPHPTRTGFTAYPGQGNNMYIFPGLGLGLCIAAVVRVTDEMIYAASVTLASTLTPDEHEDELLYPRIHRIREVSLIIAREVVKTSVKLGLARDRFVVELLDKKKKGGAEDTQIIRDYKLLTYIKGRMYEPQYVEDSVILKDRLKVLI
ncbi:hypothetical protein BJ742DRAFT_838042 [Cladochytrium replicatum]|nr:hypothetical protein BJ742DRAFT_838042 [Cladochytrium replicatum]